MMDVEVHLTERRVQRRKRRGRLRPDDEHAFDEVPRIGPRDQNAKTNPTGDSCCLAKRKQPARRSARKEFSIRIILSRIACFNSTFDSLACLANVFGKQRAILDALEDLLGLAKRLQRGSST
jgi:hypothetical protein